MMNIFMINFQENVVDGGGCGSFQNVEYFKCSKGHGLFLRLSQLKKDGRFKDAASSGASAATKEEKLSDETTSRGCEPTPTSDPLADLMSKLLAGDKKGNFSVSMYLYIII